MTPDRTTPTASDRDSWTTPQKLFYWLDKEQGADFSVDAAASIENTLCPKFWDKEANALEQDWRSERVWCNPPYSLSSSFAQKIQEASNCFMLLPVRTDRLWFQTLLHDSTINHCWITGRIHFGQSGKGAFMYSILFQKGFDWIRLPGWIDASRFNTNGKGGAKT